MSIKLSLSNDKTVELWQNFMPNKRHIKNTIGTEHYALQVYDKSLDFKDFKPSTIFTKWATVEVSDHEVIRSVQLSRRFVCGIYP